MEASFIFSWWRLLPFHSPWKPCEPPIVSQPLSPGEEYWLVPSTSRMSSQDLEVCHGFFLYSYLIWCSRRTGLTGSWSCSSGWRVRRTRDPRYRRALFGLCPARSEKDVLRDRWVLAILILSCLKSVPWEEGRMSHSVLLKNFANYERKESSIFSLWGALVVSAFSFAKLSIYSGEEC